MPEFDPKAPLPLPDWQGVTRLEGTNDQGYEVRPVTLENAWDVDPNVPWIEVRLSFREEHREPIHVWMPNRRERPDILRLGNLFFVYDDTTLRPPRYSEAMLDVAVHNKPEG